MDVSQEEACVPAVKLLPVMLIGHHLLASVIMLGLSWPVRSSVLLEIAVNSSHGLVRESSGFPSIVFFILSVKLRTLSVRAAGQGPHRALHKLKTGILEQLQQLQQQVQHANQTGQQIIKTRVSHYLEEILI